MCKFPKVLFSGMVNFVFVSLIIIFITGDRGHWKLFYHAKGIMLGAEQMPNAFQRACVILNSSCHCVY